MPPLTLKQQFSKLRSPEPQRAHLACLQSLSERGRRSLVTRFEAAGTGDQDRRVPITNGPSTMSVWIAVRMNLILLLRIDIHTS